MAGEIRTPKQEVLDAEHLLRIISHAQSRFIASDEPRLVFDKFLEDLLELTESEYGFIGEVLHDAEQNPFLKTHALTNVAWDDATRKFYEENAPTGLEFRNLKSLFGVVLTSGAPVLSNDPARDPRGCGTPPGHPSLDCFLGLPLYHQDAMVGMVGIANRPVGYEQKLVEDLRPFLLTCANLIQAYRAERARRSAQEELNRIFDLSLDLICVIDSDATISRVNPAAREILGFEPADLTGRDFLSIVHRDDRESSRQWLARLGAGETCVAFENRGLCADGAMRQLQWSGVASSTGQIHATARDITETRKVERQILELDREIQERIGHDLHDGLGQTLTGITFLSKTLEDRLVKGSAEESGQAAKIGELAKHAIAEVRALSRELSPIGASAGDLPTSLCELASNAKALSGVECAFSTGLGECWLSQEVSMHVYRIAQEAVNNSIKHAQATRLGIELGREDEKLILAIVDDGVGFQPGTSPRGLGLSLMHYRANQIGATLSIGNAPEGGTLVTCRIPSGPVGGERA